MKHAIAALLLTLVSVAHAQTVTITPQARTYGYQSWTVKTEPQNQTYITLPQPQITTPVPVEEVRRPALACNGCDFSRLFERTPEPVPPPVPLTDWGRCMHSPTPADWCDLAWLMSKNYISKEEYAFARSQGYSIAEIVKVVLKDAPRPR